MKSNARSQLVTIRLEHRMIAALKEIAVELDQPWQTVMKALLGDALGLEGKTESPAQRTTYSAPHLNLARAKLRKP